MKILHCADIHIGYETHGKNINGKNSRVEDFDKAFSYMVEYALKEKIDLFLFSGDGFRNALPSPTEQDIFLRNILPLIDHDIPIVMVVGNHDNPASYEKINALQLYHNAFRNKVYVFNKPHSKMFQTKSGNIKIIGMPWPMPNHFRTKEELSTLSQETLKEKILEYYMRFLQKETEDVNEDYPCVVAAHLHTEGAVFTEGSERSIETKDPIFPLSMFRHSNISYVALGHIHRHQNLNPTNDPPIVYAGSIERISFMEWEQVKGFMMVEFEKNVLKSFKHIPIPVRPFQSIEIELDMTDDLMKRMIERLEKENLHDAIVRIRVRCHSLEQKNSYNKSLIEKYLSTAFHIYQIIIIYKSPKSEAEYYAYQNLSVLDSLERYINANQTLKPYQEKLLQKGKEIESELEKETYENL